MVDADNVKGGRVIEQEWGQSDENVVYTRLD